MGASAGGAQPAATLARLEAAVAALRADLAAAQAGPAGALRALDKRLTSIEASVDTAAARAREAAASADAAAARAGRAAGDAVAAASGGLRRALATDMAAALASAGESSGATAAAAASLARRLDGRFAGLEAALASAQAASADAAADAVDRVVSELAAVLEDATTGMAATVRGELARSVPQALAAALPVTDVGPLSGALVRGGSQPGPLTAQLTPAERDWWKATLSTELARAAAAMSDAAGAAVVRAAEAARVGPVDLAPAQWSALGRRLSALESALEAATVASSAGPSAAEVGGVVAELVAAREELGGALSAVAAAATAAGRAADAAAEAGAAFTAVVGAGNAGSDVDGDDDDEIATATPALEALLARVDAAVARLEDAAVARPPAPAPGPAAAEDTSPASPRPSTPRPGSGTVPIASWLGEQGVPVPGGGGGAAVRTVAVEAEAAPATPPSAQDPMVRGKAALRDGRALIRTPGARESAAAALTAAVAAFDEAAATAGSSSPSAASAAGNAGNALSALATLRAQTAADAAADGDVLSATSAADAADAAWVAAGERYRAVAASGGGREGKNAPVDGRALANWARALAARAGLALTWPGAGGEDEAASFARAERLLESAAAKLDAVLAADPADARAAVEAGLVLTRLASLKPAGSPAERAALQDAVSYFGDARAGGVAGGGGEGGSALFDQDALAAAAQATGRLRELMAVGPPPSRPL